MKTYRDKTPDCSGSPPQYIHLIIKSKTVNNDRADYIQFYGDGKQLAANLDFRNKGGIITHHGLNRVGEFYPHLHLLYWHSKDCRNWRVIRELLRRRGYRYEWSAVISLANISKYLQEGEHREVLAAQTGVLFDTGPEGMDDFGFESKEELERRCGLSQHHVQHTESSSDSRKRHLQEDGRTSDSDSDGMERPIRRKNKVQRTLLDIQQALQALQCTSLSEFKEAVYTMPEYQHLITSFYSKNFLRDWQIAQEMCCFQHRKRTWEESLHLFNIDTLERAHGKFLSPNDSVSWIKEWLTWNKINIREFVGNVKKVVDKEVVKFNSIQLHGPPNSYKTVIATSICHSLIYYFNNNQLNGRTSQFGLQEAIDKRIAFLDEIAVDDSWKEKFLLLLGGNHCNTDKKFEAPQQISRLPVILCFNKGK